MIHVDDCPITGSPNKVKWIRESLKKIERERGRNFGAPSLHKLRLEYWPQSDDAPRRLRAWYYRAIWKWVWRNKGVYHVTRISKQNIDKKRRRNYYDYWIPIHYWPPMPPPPTPALTPLPTPPPPPTPPPTPALIPPWTPLPTPPPPPPSRKLLPTQHHHQQHTQPIATSDGNLRPNNPTQRTHGLEHLWLTPCHPLLTPLVPTEHQGETDDDDPAAANDTAHNKAQKDGAITEYTHHKILPPQEQSLPPIRAQTCVIAAGTLTTIPTWPPGMCPMSWFAIGNLFVGQCYHCWFIWGQR